MKKKRIALIIAASFMSLVMLAGCGAGNYMTEAMETTAAGPNTYAGEYYEEADGASVNSANRYAKSGNATMGARKNVAETEAAADTDTDSVNNHNADQGQGQTQTQTNVDPTKGRLLIRTVNMVAETTDFDNVRQSVETKIKDLGGYIEKSGVSGTGKAGSLHNATYTIRIPAERLDELINAVGSNCTVTSSSESTTDVTLSYVDTKARLDSLRVEQEQLTELLKQAKDLDSIIVLQDRLTQVRYQIESAESTLRVLENQVTYATLSLRIREVMEIKPQEQPHVDTYGEKIVKTFKNSLKNIGEFFKGLFLVIVAVSPVIVPLLIINIVIIAILLSARKKRRAKIAAAKAAQQAQYQAQIKAAAKPAETKPEEKKTEEKKDEEKK